MVLPAYAVNYISFMVLIIYLTIYSKKSTSYITCINKIY